MVKKILSIVLAVLMLLSIATVVASAATTTDAATGAAPKIRFDASKMGSYKTIYCHVWVNNGDSFFAWKASASECKKVAGSIYEYDLANLASSSAIPGGYKSGEDYCVIFHADSGMQTYDLTMGDECNGDTAVMTEKQIENPVDSEKSSYEAVWKKNSAKYGPHRAITSIGNFVGSVLCPGESGTEVIPAWLIGAPNAAAHCKPAEVVAKAMKEFGVKDTTAMAAYIEKNNNSINSNDILIGYITEGYKIAYGEEVVIDESKVAEIKKDLDSGKEISDVTTDTNKSSSGGSSLPGGSSSIGTVNNSGTGSDGQNDTILFVLGGIMLLAAVVFVTTRKRD